MPQLRRRFRSAAVGQVALVAAYERFVDERTAAEVARLTLRIDRRDESWELDRVHDFFEEYARGPCRAVLLDETGEEVFSYADDWGAGELTVRLGTVDRVRRVVAALDVSLALAPFTIFVGHGRNPQWQVLTSHLRESHGFHVVTYETLAAYGQPAAQVLEFAARTASVALLVHTGELETADGARHPVPNVVHETGFFRAHLGPQRALVLREDSCRPFTNIAGLTEIRFSDGNIREVFGDVVAELRRQSGASYPPGYHRL